MYRHFHPQRGEVILGFEAESEGWYVKAPDGREIYPVLGVDRDAEWLAIFPQGESHAQYRRDIPLQDVLRRTAKPIVTVMFGNVIPGEG